MEVDTRFRIIVIDDNPAIHHDFMKILTKQSTMELDDLSSKLFGKQLDELKFPLFEITTASQGQEGVQLISKAIEENQPYALAFVDIRMPPGWDGVETIKHIWEIDKDMQIVICTAYSDYSWEETVDHLGKTDNLLILKKPFDHTAVRQLACALTTKWELHQKTRQYTSNLENKVEDRTLLLQKSLSLVKATLESSNDGILVVSNKGDIVDYNQKFLSIWSVSPDIIQTLSKEKFIDLMKGRLLNPDPFIKQLEETNKNPDSSAMIDIKFNDGKIIECFSQPQKLNDQTVGRVFNFHDMTKRAHLEEKLQYQAMHDDLTGLPNRILMMARINQAIETSDRNGTIAAIMFIDLDRFKLINDSLSHAVGDELLQVTASRLQASLRAEDTLARLGGDEFVIIFTNISHEDNVIALAQKVKDTFREPFYIAERSVTVTASIGISLYPNNGASANVLLSNADAAMYSAKEAGANNFQFYTIEMNNHSLAKLDRETQLRNALINDELFLNYQPEYDINTGRIVAAEALLRWHHPEKGILLPIDFVPLAEETGLIISIGEWVIRTACKQNKAWFDAGLPPMRVAVNVVSQQLKQKNFVSIVGQILQESGLKPELLEIELTENIIINSLDIIKTITDLKELGVTIALDDFGTGYTSLGHLNKIPLDRLKIDRSFIENIKTVDDDDVIIRAVIAMAHNLNLEVLAEGVETEQQLNFLKTHHCSEVQGYYYSQPLNAESFRELLDKSKKIIS